MSYFWLDNILNLPEGWAVNTPPTLACRLIFVNHVFKKKKKSYVMLQIIKIK